MISLIGETIIHKMNGKGEVVSFDEGTMILNVRFRSGVVIPLQYPESFEDGMITFQNDDLQQTVHIRSKNERTFEFTGNNNQGGRAFVESKQRPQKISHPKKKMIDVVDNPYDWEEKQDRRCETCQRYKRSLCAGLRNPKTCPEYEAIPHITKAEMYLWKK